MSATSSLHDSFIPQYDIQSYSVRIPLTEAQQMTLGQLWMFEDWGDYFLEYKDIVKFLAPYGVRDIDYRGQYFYMTIPQSEDTVEVIRELLKFLDGEI